MSVLSVQSHVVHGYVGGRAATFPLQFLGWNVDNINTVNFSNHTGYGFVKGSAITAAEMTALFRGLADINCRYDAVILGYVPSADLLDVLGTNLVLLKKNKPDLLYLCDPVMGDQGQLYVDESCVAAYRRLLATKTVDIITPNQFELELLCECKISSDADLRAAISHIHNTYNVRHVVVSSLGGEFVVGNKPDPNSIYCAVSPLGATSLRMFRIPVIKSYFTGVGDLFTALLLAKYYKIPDDLPTAVNQVLTVMGDVLRLTHRLGVEEYCHYKKIAVPALPEEMLESKMNDADSMRFFELRVIQAREYYDYSGPGKLDSFEV